MHIPSLAGTAEENTNANLVADASPLGTTVLQYVPERTFENKQKKPIRKHISETHQSQKWLFTITKLWVFLLNCRRKTCQNFCWYCTTGFWIFTTLTLYWDYIGKAWTIWYGKCWSVQWGIMKKNRTNEAALGHMEVVATWGNPHATAVGTDQAWVTLRLLPEECHTQALGNPLHRSFCGRGNTLRGLDQCLEKATLFEHYIICDAHLYRRSSV